MLIASYWIADVKRELASSTNYRYYSIKDSLVNYNNNRVIRINLNVCMYAGMTRS